LISFDFTVAVAFSAIARAVAVAANLAGRELALPIAPLAFASTVAFLARLHVLIYQPTNTTIANKPTPIASIIVMIAFRALRGLPPPSLPTQDEYPNRYRANSGDEAPQATTSTALSSS